MKKALITGITGQDGSYLAEYLLGLGYSVTGLSRFTSKEFAHNLLPDVRNKVPFIYGDMRNKLSLEVAISKTRPDEIYNLAGQSFVPPSWLHGGDTIDINAGGLARILEVVLRLAPKCRVYQASSSEMFGNHEGKANELSPMDPLSPYGVAKLAAHKLVHVYREQGLYVVSGILFNHESPRRGPEMVTRKICRHVARWAKGDREPLFLGNLQARRDWGFAADYVKAMHAMLQQPAPDDYVVGTGETHSVEELVHAAVAAAGLKWEDVAPLLDTDKSLVRANEIAFMCADNQKAKSVLGWEPYVDFRSLITLMVHHELHLIDTGGVPLGHSSEAGAIHDAQLEASFNRALGRK